MCRARSFCRHSERAGKKATPRCWGAGAELKGTICLTRGHEAFVGQHIGDLENPATLGFYEEVATHLESLLEVRPKAIV